MANVSGREVSALAGVARVNHQSGTRFPYRKTTSSIIATSSKPTFWTLRLVEEIARAVKRPKDNSPRGFGLNDLRYPVSARAFRATSARCLRMGPVPRPSPRMSQSLPRGAYIDQSPVYVANERARRRRTSGISGESPGLGPHRRPTYWRPHAARHLALGPAFVHALRAGMCDEGRIGNGASCFLTGPAELGTMPALQMLCRSKA